MELNLNRFIRILSLFSVLFLSLHFLLLRAFPSFIGLSAKSLIAIYLFLIFLSLAHFIGLKWLFHKWPRYSGFIFTAISLFKMAVAILFLLPSIFPANATAMVMALNFMTVYLAFLALEVVFLVKNLMKNQ
ncbi:MAG: hypothetical protein AB7S69_01055 [Salinivirgaceae bacterium]